MPEEIAALDQRISQLKNYVVVLALLWAGTTGVCLMTMSPYAARAAHRSPRPSKFPGGSGTGVGTVPRSFDLNVQRFHEKRRQEHQTYLEEGLSLSRAIAVRVPAAKFGMPDVASAVSWLNEIADQWPSIHGKDATGPLQVTTTNDPADPVAWPQWHHWNLASQLFKVRLSKPMRYSPCSAPFASSPVSVGSEC
jgi:hypothetical protein